MTEKFDNYINSVLESVELITEAKKCDGPSLRQLSDKEGFRWMACRENPYSPGFKRIYWGQKGKPVNIMKCIKSPPTKGQRRWEDCRDAIQAFKYKIAKRKRLKAMNTDE